MSEIKKSSDAWKQGASLATVCFEQMVPVPAGEDRLRADTEMISSTNAIRIRVDSKSFEKRGRQIAVLRNVELVIPSGEFLSINGPNGCGKTTLLKIIAGLDNDFVGKTNVDNSINNVSFVFQSYKESLFPWMTNLDNISYSSLLKRHSKRERYKDVRLFLDKYNLTVNLDAYPYQQSGGQQQIVSILRAMFSNPQLLIMDEPFSSLDQSLRLKMNEMVQKYWEEHRSTIIFVSHDLDESLLLADRQIVLRSLDTRSRPSILGDFKIDFPRPRRSRLIESIDFFDFKSRILSLKRRDVENA